MDASSLPSVSVSLLVKGRVVSTGVSQEGGLVTSRGRLSTSMVVLLVPYSLASVPGGWSLLLFTGQTGRVSSGGLGPWGSRSLVRMAQLDDDLEK